MPTEMEALEASLSSAADEMIKAGAIAPATTGPVWNDGDKKAMLELLQGSLLKFTDGSGSHSYGVVPVGPDALGGPTATKIGYHQTGGGALSGKTSVQLIAAGLTHIIPGVLTLDGGAGREASKLAIAGLPATIQPIVASPFTSIGIAVGGGAAEDKAI